MIKEKIALEAGKQLVKNWKSWIEPLRRFLTRGARKRRDKEIILPALAFLVLVLATGCARFDNAMIGIDDRYYNSSTAKIAVPEGYLPRPYVQDAAGTRVDVTGWQVRWEIIPAPTFLPTFLPDAIARQRVQPSPLAPVLSLIQANGPLVMNEPEQSGAGDAAATLQAEAAKDGAK